MNAAHATARRSPARRFCRRIATALLLSWCVAVGAPQRASEQDVEAAYLVNFLRYTQWPEHSFATPTSPYVLTVVGSAEIASSVRAVAQAAGPIDGRPIEVRWMGNAESGVGPAVPARDVADGWRASHLLFIHQSAGSDAERHVVQLAGEPVLTVSDLPGFTAAGGMLELVRASGHVVFDANPAAIRNSGLVVSAKVLKLARSIGGPPA